MTHNILHIFLDINFLGNEKKALGLHNCLTLVCQDIVFPALTKSLDKITPADSSLCIDPNGSIKSFSGTLSSVLIRAKIVSPATSNILKEMKL